MTWLDVLLAVLFSAFVALGVERRFGGFVLGVGGVLLLRPLLALGAASPVLAVAGALLAGLVLALASRAVSRRRRLNGPPFALLGGLGGGILGAALVVTAVVSLPIERNPAGQIVYPPQELPGVIASGVRGSRLVREGRDILLYPLLVRQDAVGGLRQPVIEVLHEFFVVGEPWERR